MAVASPPPMHIAAIPRRRPYFSQRCEQGDHDARAGCADGVAESAGAAVNIHFVVGNAEIAHGRHGHYGEGLIDFEQIDIADRQAGLLQEPCELRRWARWERVQACSSKWSGPRSLRPALGRGGLLQNDA